VRTTFYRIATIAAQKAGCDIGRLSGNTRFTVTSAWSVTLFAAAAFFLALFIYHAFVLPVLWQTGRPRGTSRKAL